MGSKFGQITDSHAIASRGNGSRNGGNGKPSGQSLYERLGGGRAITAVVEAFYERVLADPHLKPFFEYTDMDWLKRSQVAFLSQAFGGPARYKGQDMKAAHAGLGITDNDFNRVATHLTVTMESLGVAPALIEEVISVAATLAPAVVDRKTVNSPAGHSTGAREHGSGPADSAFRAMLESAPINVMMTDKDFNIVYINPASKTTLEKLEKYLPVPVSRVVGSSIDVFHKVPSHQRSLLSNPKNLPHRAKIQIGPEIADLLVSPIYDQDGSYLGPMVTWEVISEKEQMELEAARLKAMVENAPINMMLAGTDFVINYVNPASLKTLKEIEKLLPVPAEKVLGSSIDIFHKNPAHQRGILSNHKNLPHRAHIQIGTETAELLVSPIFDKSGNFMGPMVTWEIITQKLETERKVKEAAEREKAQAQDMKGKVDAMKKNIANLASSSEELNAISQQMSANSEETSAQATVVSGAAEEVSRNLQTVSTGTEEMMASIKEIAKNANEAAKVATSAVKVAEDTNATVTKLGDSSVEIGKVIKVITSIAQQTNLLALNATIEAARAGEAGKGFAVVANEVKELAKETAKATEEIGQKIQAIQTDSKGAVEAIAQITGIINQINEISTTIASAVEEQAATTTDIGRNVSEAAKGSQEIAHNILGVAQAAQSTTTGAANTQQAAAELARMSTELQEVVSSIKTS